MEFREESGSSFRSTGGGSGGGEKLFVYGIEKKTKLKKKVNVGFFKFKMEGF